MPLMTSYILYFFIEKNSKSSSILMKGLYDLTGVFNPCERFFRVDYKPNSRRPFPRLKIIHETQVANDIFSLYRARINNYFMLLATHSISSACIAPLKLSTSELSHMRS
jgi:hypothetical protein